MRKINFDFLPERLRLWVPPLVGIPAMLALGVWIKELSYLLFGHHLFWMIGIFLLINPVSETFWPSARTGKPITRIVKPRPSSRSRRRAESRKQIVQRKPAPASETSAERLARLQKDKEAVDKELEKLTPNPRSGSK